MISGKGGGHVLKQRQGLCCQDSWIGVGGARAHSRPAGDLQVQRAWLLTESLTDNHEDTQGNQLMCISLTTSISEAQWQPLPVPG